MADSAEWIEELHARGVTDGLPVVPPTPERVRAAVEASGRLAHELVSEGRAPHHARREEAAKVTRTKLARVRTGARLKGIV